MHAPIRSGRCRICHGYRSVRPNDPAACECAPWGETCSDCGAQLTWEEYENSLSGRCSLCDSAPRETEHGTVAHHEDMETSR